MAKKSIEQVDVAGKRVLMRVDFNVPLDAGGAITDDRRVRLALPSIQSVVNRGGRLVLMSHLGRPAGKGPEPSLSLKPVAERLGELLEMEVGFAAGDAAGDAAAGAVAALADGQIVMLDNLRFSSGERAGDPGFSATLASYGDIFCHEAFGTAHRSDASVVAVPMVMSGKPRVAGLLLGRELQYLSHAVVDPKRPFVAVLGGAKVSDKLAAFRNLMSQVDTILVGGAMAYTFLESLGRAVGTSKVQPDMRDEARAIMDAAAASHTSMILPTDHVCGKQMISDTPVRIFETSIEDGWMGLDIGPNTTGQFVPILHAAGTVVWNGPMGVFEYPPFDVGTRQVAEAMAAATGKGAITVAGGGDTAAALESFGLADGLTHVSTGGGASLRMLEGKALKSVDLLDEA